MIFLVSFIILIRLMDSYFMIFIQVAFYLHIHNIPSHISDNSGRKNPFYCFFILCKTKLHNLSSRTGWMLGFVALCWSFTVLVFYRILQFTIYTLINRLKSVHYTSYFIGCLQKYSSVHSVYYHRRENRCTSVS